MLGARSTVPADKAGDSAEKAQQEPRPAVAPDGSIYWKEIAAGAEPFLMQVGERLRAQTAEFQADIASYAKYALSVQGKQLRPMLVCLAGEAAGGLTEDHVTVATIIEMVHLATLVHDDIIDLAALRRGRPTLAAKWGNKISVLLGDCLFAKSVKLAAGFPTPEVCRAVSSATDNVCEGEILQTQARGNFDISHQQYFRMLSMKTAELFAVSCELGAFCASGSTSKTREALRQYGMALGTAYQIYDDCLDLFGSEKQTGKNVGVDLAEGKMTLPLLVVRDMAQPVDQAALRQYFTQWSPTLMPELMQLLTKYRALALSRETIRGYLSAAREALTRLPSCEAKAGLVGLTHFLAEQTEAFGK
jgi:octaprenyl-diphosphate synthase